MKISARLTIAMLLLLASFTAGAVPADALADAAKVEWQWGVKIPLRDGVRLNATLYKPAGLKEPRPCLFTLTPYIGQSYHDRGMYFAAHGYPFLTVDVRGRGNSEGVFQPLIQEAKEFPPHLATIVPVASPAAGVDFPARNNIFSPYDM
ncbi:MAG TPA: CocE/NonD family hydrolase [Steroidobacteraceae bacterium]